MNLCKTEYNKFKQIALISIELLDKNKEYQLRQIFKDYFKNKEIGVDELIKWLIWSIKENPEFILYEVDEHYPFILAWNSKAEDDYYADLVKKLNTQPFPQPHLPN